MKHKTICLNMIVKDEKEVILRSLQSVKEKIDYWVIIDTGSTDGTQEIIRDSLKEIPGELHQRPWVDFGHNRNEAIALSKNKGDYLLFIDADEELSFSDDFIMPPLNEDYYLAITYCNDHCYSHRILLANNHLDWEWKGVLHEELVSIEAKSGAHLENVFNKALFRDGNRSKDPQTIYKDVQVLEKALEEDPENRRYWFHLALAYESLNEREASLKTYEKRVKLGGGNELEIFYSLYRIGILQELLGMPSETFIKTLLKAHDYRPTRPEPLFSLVRHFLQSKQYLLAYLLSKHALSISYIDDAFFTQRQIYNFGLVHQFAECSYHLKKFEETRIAIQELLSNQDLSVDLRQQLENNLCALNSSSY
jgi:glycosyltransferase involved in cell wall biosynthesis